MMNAIYVTANTFFESLYLVLGLRKIAPGVNCRYAPTTPTVHSTTISRFQCNFFPRVAPHFFGHHDSPSNLAKSGYPHYILIFAEIPDGMQTLLDVLQEFTTWCGMENER